MTAYGPFFKRICSHTAAAGFAVTWIAGLCKQVTPERIFIRSLIAAALFWMLGAFITRYAFGPPPRADAPEDRPGSEGSQLQQP